MNPSSGRFWPAMVNAGCRFDVVEPLGAGELGIRWARGRDHEVIRVVSYNLKDYGKSAVEVRERQHGLLDSEQPDVLCLQEIWDDRDDLSDLHRHVATLADALGMHALAVPAPRSACHLALLWRPEYPVLSRHTFGWDLWHGLGVAVLDIGAAVPLRVGVTHLSPWDPDKRFADTRTVAALLGDPKIATVIGGDWNLLCADESYDPEPDWARLRPDKAWRHVLWQDDPHAPHRTDRRPAQLLQRSGFVDAAPYLGVPWQPTSGHTGRDMARRRDAFWINRPSALRAYRVLAPPAARPLSDHLPILVDLDPDALEAGSSGQVLATRSLAGPRPGTANR